MDSFEQTPNEPEKPRHPLWHRLLSQPEGKILLAGILLMLAYGTFVGLTRIWSQDLYHSLWLMTTAHVVAGRAAGISSGLSHNLRAWVVILANMGIETVLVLLFYPLFVFSCRKLFVIKPLEAAIERLRAAAEAHHRAVVRFGIPGLLLFVWIPLPMTGPLVGSVIGFILGLQPLVNVAVVLAGTYAAILCWTAVLHQVVERLERIGTFLPFVLVAFLLLIGLGLHIRSLFAKHAGKAAEGEGTGP